MCYPKITKVAETAPERIWLQVSDLAEDNEEPFPVDGSTYEGITWCCDSVLDCEVQYVRADVPAKRICSLEQQRDKLLEALRLLVITYDEGGNLFDNHKKLIASVEERNERREDARGF